MNTAEVNAATAAMGWTPLRLAAHLSGADVLARFQRTQAVALLLESGARADSGSLFAVFEETFQYSGSADNLLDLLLRGGVAALGFEGGV